MGEDRRKLRTRAALIKAFNEMVLEGKRPDIRVADLVARAKVGRSKFYEQDSSAEDVLAQALTRPLAILADAIAGTRDTTALATLMQHAWQNRRRAHKTLGGAERDGVARLLAGLVAKRLRTRDAQPVIPLEIATLQIAEAQLTLIRAWLAGKSTATAPALARTIVRSSELFRASLFPDES